MIKIIVLNFVFMVIQCLNQSEYTFNLNTQSQSPNDWPGSYQLSTTTTCSLTILLGGYQALGMSHYIIVFAADFIYKRYWQLSAHYKVYIFITFYQIDLWDDDIFYVVLNQKTVYQSYITTNSSGTNLCGDSMYNDEIYTIKIEANHTEKYAQIQMYAEDRNLDNSNRGFWGFSYFGISIQTCPTNCDYCESDNDCKKWKLYTQSPLSSFFSENINYWYNTYKLHTVVLSQALPMHNYVTVRNDVSQKAINFTCMFRLSLHIDSTCQIKMVIDNQITQIKQFTLYKASSLLKELFVPSFQHSRNILYSKQNWISLQKA